MSYQHFLPATFLANFSLDKNPIRRDRTLAAGNTINGRVFTTNAESLGGMNDLFTLTSSRMDPLLVDRSLSGYEASLANALEQLAQKTIHARVWVTILVPFATALFVRGPDFNMRFSKRITQMGLETGSDNTNLARLFEYQRLIAPVFTAKWLFLEIEGTEPLITNDVGWAPFANPLNGDVGMAIPIDLSHILLIIPTLERIVAESKGGVWLPLIEYGRLPRDNHIQLNHILAKTCRNLIIGPDEKVISRYVIAQHNSIVPPEPGNIGFVSGRQAMIHEHDWLKLLSLLQNPPSTDGIAVFNNLLRTP
jgi:hypothetical protein